MITGDTGVYSPQRGSPLAAHGNAVGFGFYQTKSKGAPQRLNLFGIGPAGSNALTGRLLFGDAATVLRVLGEKLRW